MQGIMGKMGRLGTVGKIGELQGLWEERVESEIDGGMVRV